MKKRVLSIVITVLVLLLAIFSFTACGEIDENTNLVKNGAFEDFNDSKFDNWTVFDESKGTYEKVAPAEKENNAKSDGFNFGKGILKLKNEYEISSNNFSGKGRYDLLLKPKNIFERKEGIIIELKAINIDNLKLDSEKIHEKLLSECEVALNQIEEKEYTSILKNAGIDNILKIGIAFFGKEFEVKFERE